LIPVCPNCHAMLHRFDPPLTIRRLRSLLRHANKASTPGSNIGT
jgi:predicted HNH restriction endonuclease